MKKKIKLIIIIGIITIISIVIATLLVHGVIIDQTIDESRIIPKEKITIEVSNNQTRKENWLKNKEINSDYIGDIVFSSGLIDKPFVQAKGVYDSNNELYHFYNEDGTIVNNPKGYDGNDVYIWTNWKDMSYDFDNEGGSIFMDYRNSLDDQNIIIYGHHFSKEVGLDSRRNKAFTPLELLLNEENYKENCEVKLILDNEERTYELVCVYKFDINDNYCLDNLQYYRTNYNYDEYGDVVDNEYYQKYIDNLKKVELYDTGIDLNISDKTLTLQTCISGLAGSVYEICVFKQTNIEIYE